MNQLDYKMLIETQNNNRKEKKKDSNHKNNNKNENKKQNKTNIPQQNKKINNNKEQNKLTSKKITTRSNKNERKFNYKRLWNQNYDLGTWNKPKILQAIHSSLKEKITNSNDLSTSTTSINKSN